MKLFSKLILTVLGGLLLLGGLWSGLPTILEMVAKEQLAQAGFFDVEIDISDVTLQSLKIQKLSISNSDYLIGMKEGQANYDVARLLAGQVISIEINEIEVHKVPSDTNSGTSLLPDPALISSMLLTPWRQYNPADYMVLDKLRVFDESGQQILSASLDVSTQGEGTQADIRLLDSKGERHSISLLVFDESINLQWVSLDSRAENPVSVTVKPKADGSGLTGQASLNFSALKGIVPELAEFSGQMKSEFSYISNQPGDQQVIQFKASIVNFVLAGSGAKNINVELNASIVENEDGINLKFSPLSTISMTGVWQGEDNIEKIDIKLPDEIDLREGRPVFRKKHSAIITASNVSMGSIKLPEVEIREMNISKSKADKSVLACAFGATIDVPLVIIDDVNMKSSPFKTTGNCAVESNPFSLLRTKTKRLSIEGKDFQASFVDCNVTLKAGDRNMEKISGIATCQNNTSSGMMKIDYFVNSSKGTGHADYSFTGIKPDNDKPLISSLIKSWQLPFDIVSGRVAAKGRYSWWKDKKKSREKLVMDLNIEDAGGYYEDVLFSGLNYKDKVDILPDVSSSKYTHLNISDIDIGIPVTSFNTEIMLMPSSNGDLPIVKLKTLGFSVLDGEIKGNGLTVDLNNDEHEMVLVVDGIDLAQIVDMQKLDGLAATGRLDGYFPVTITPKGVKITRGKIVAQKQGGYIHYRPEEGTSAMEKAAIGSEFVFRIIEDLDYDSLNIDVDFAEDGEMDMKFAIKGMSPKVDERRPIHFNLNLQQNVLQLLKGLRYAEGLSEGIDKNVQKLFRK